MAQRTRAGPSRAYLALLAIFLALIYSCERMHESFRFGADPEGIGRAMENIRLPDGETGTITGNLASASDASAQGPYEVHVEGFRGTAVSAAAGESFTLANVPVGARRVFVYQRTAADPLGGTYLGMISDSVTVASGQTSDVGTLTLKTAGAIHGSVVGVDGAETFAFIPGTWFTARVERDGSYTLQGVPEGDYRITVARAGSLDGYSDLFSVVGGVMVNAPTVTIAQPFVIPGAIALDQGAAYAGSRTVSVAISQDAAANLIMLSESATFSGASWHAIPETVEYTFAADGPHRLYAKFKVSGKYETTPVTDDIYVFTGAPTGTLAMKNGALYTAERDVVLAITGGDIAGVTEMMLSEEASFEGAAWEPFAVTRNFTLSTGYGMKTIYMKLKDSCGHVSEAISTEVGYEPDQHTPPILAVAEGAYTNTRNITLKATIPTGTAPLRWALASESADLAGASWQPYGAGLPFTLSAGEGSKTIYAKFKNSDGQTFDTVSATTWLDLTPPTTPAISNASRRVTATVETIVITTPSTDALFKTYVARGGAYADWTEVTPPIVFTLAKDDSWYTLEVRGKDLAGNMSESAVVRLFRGNQTILDGSAAQLTGETSRSASSATATLGILYSPFLLRDVDSSLAFTDYNLAVEPGVVLNVTAELDVNLTGLSVAGTAAKHVMLTSANSTKAPGDWRILTLDGALNLNYLDVAYYTYAMIAASATPVTISDSSFTNFQSYGLRDYATGGATFNNIFIRCTSTAVTAAYATNAAKASLHTFSGAEIENCKVGMNIGGASSVTMTGSNVIGSTTNVYISSSATGTITFTGDYFGYGTSSGTLADLRIINGSSTATFNWTPYLTVSVIGTGPQ